MAGAVVTTVAPEAAGAQPLAALITGPLTPAGVLGSQSLAVAEASPTVTLTGTATNAGSTITVEDYGVPVATATATTLAPVDWSVTVSLVEGPQELTAVETLDGVAGAASAPDWVDVAGDQLVDNGSFEDDVVASTSNGNGWENFNLAGEPSVTGWVPANALYPNNLCGIELQTEATVGVTAYDRSQYAELASNCAEGVAQTLGTVPGTQYVLSFAYQGRPGTNPDENTMSVAWGETYLAGSNATESGLEGCSTGPAGCSGGWQVGQYTVTATSSSTTIEFGDTNSNIQDSEGDFLDDVSVVPVAALEPANTTWLTAEDLALSPETVGTTKEYSGSPNPEQAIAFPGEGLWYDFAIDPGEQVQVSLSNLPADYNVDLFSDIATTFQSEASSTPDLAALGAESSASAFSASAFSASAFSASAFSASAFSASAFSASAFSASAFSASAFSASAFSGSGFSTAYSDAQINSLVAESTEPGAVDKSVTADTWNDTGNFYVYISANNGAYSSLPFDLSVTTSGSTCGQSLDTNTTPTMSGAGTSYSTVIVENTAVMDARYPTAEGILDGTDGELDALATAPGVNGVVVDVSQDPTVQALETQAQDNPSCPYAENLVAETIQNIINSYRTSQNNLKYVVLVGDDDIIPFFRYPDNAGLAPESDYVPPLLSTSPANAALQDDYYLTDDPYGAASELTVQGAPLPLPTAAVGRLVETPGDIAGTIESYIAKQTLRPTTALATGYDFMAAPAGQVAQAFTAGLGPSNVDTSLESGPWTATNLMTDLSDNAHGLVFLGAHFSANNLLAGDDTTTLTTNTFAQDIGSQLEESLVLSPGCHSGYNIDPADGISGVTDDLAWPQAFTEAGATLIAGTGYQYGDSNYVAYSDQVYVDLAQQLSYGQVNIGTALLEAKQQYLSTLFQLNGLEVKALLQITLYGLPMLGLKETTTVSGLSAPTSVISPNAVSGVVGGPGQALGLEKTSLSYSASQAPALDQKPVGTTAYTYDSYASSPQLTAVPGGPVLPVLTEDVNVSGETLRGVGFMSGTYNDLSGTNPLTGDPAVDTSNAIVPFSSPTFFPQTNWNPNYYNTLVDGGDTELAITPLQYESDPGGATTATRRTYSNMGLQLFYDEDTSSAGGETPALAAAPQISHVSSTVEGDVVNVTADVSGDVSAGIQNVWVTYTDNSSGALYGTWSSVYLSQAAPGVWTGSYTDSGGTPASDSLFMVQAVNGVGEVSLDNNGGYYFTPTFTPGASPPSGVTTNTYTLQLSGALSGAYGTTATVLATLAGTSGDPSPNVNGDVVTFGLGSTTATAVTSDGTATANIPLTNAPGPYELTASYAGDANDQPVGTQTSFQVTQAPTTLQLTAPPPVITSGVASGVSATLTTAGTALQQKPVYFELSNGTSVIGGSLGITNASGVAQAGAITVPSGDVGGGYYITAYFGSSSVPLPAGQTYNASDPDYASSTSGPDPLAVLDSPTTLVLTSTSGANSSRAKQGTSVTGQSIVYTATVSATPSGAGTPAGTPTGTVSFTYTPKGGNATTLCSSLALSGASATCTDNGAFLATGSPYVVTATYVPTVNYVTSTASVTDNVRDAFSTTSLTAPRSSKFGPSVTLTASVKPAAPGSGAPTGTVMFFDGLAALGTATLSSGVATLTVSGLPGASQLLTALYAGNSEFIGSIGVALTSTTFTQTITGTDSGSLSITSGQLVLVTGKVTGAVSVSPGGGLEVDGGSIGGAVSASGAVGLILCDAKVGGAMSVSGSTGYVTVGGGTLCAPSTVSGAVSFSGNKGGLQVAGSSIGGAASVSGNSGSATDLVGDRIGGALSVTSNTSPSTEVAGNTIGGALACSSNVPPPTDAGQTNKAAVKSGQCAGATF
jgi:hypothetical protein